MPAVPRVEPEHRIERRCAPLRMLDRAGKIRWTHAAEQRDPALVQRRQQIERHRDRGAHLRCLGPVLFLVCLDRRGVFGEPPLEAHVGIHVAVGEVMRHLAHRPPAGAIRRVELRIVEAGDRAAEVHRRRGDLLDAAVAVSRRQLGDGREPADGIPLVGHWSTRQPVVHSVVPHLMRSVPRSSAYPVPGSGACGTR